jgi:replication factor A1
MKDDEEFRKRLVEIKEHFADLIDDETAENLAAYSFGVIPKTELGKIEKRKGKVYVEGIVDRVYPLREFEKNGKVGRVASFLLKDDAVVRVNLWDDAALLVESGDILEGMRVRLKGYVRKGELNVRDATDIEIELDFEKTSSIVPDTRVNLRGRVSGIGEFKTTDRFRVAEIYLSDETGRVRILLWDKNVDAYMKADIGDYIEILNGYAKVGRDGEVEVHVGRNSSVRFGE